MNSFFIRLLVITLFISSCNSENPYIKEIEEAETAYGLDNHKSHLAYMTYIMRDGRDLDYSLELVDKLITARQFPEARYALDKLAMENKDYRIFYLKAVCYRNEYQYDNALLEIQKARNLSSDNIVEREFGYIREEQEVWQRIEALNDSIKDSDRPELKFRRAGLFVSMDYIEAAYLDLDSLIRNGKLVNECYDLRIRTAILVQDYKLADSLTGLWDRVADEKWAEKSGKLKENLDKLIGFMQKADSPQAGPVDFINTGRQLILMKQFESSREWLENGIARFPDAVNLKIALLLNYIESGDIKQGIDYSRALQQQGIAIPPQILTLLEKGNM